MTFPPYAEANFFVCINDQSFVYLILLYIITIFRKIGNLSFSKARTKNVPAEAISYYTKNSKLALSSKPLCCFLPKVRITGLEPARGFPPEPKSGASANSAISAYEISVSAPECGNYFIIYGLLPLVKT